MLEVPLQSLLQILEVPGTRVRLLLLLPTLLPRVVEKVLLVDFPALVPVFARPPSGREWWLDGRSEIVRD